MKIYIKYIINNFIKLLFLVSFIFFILVLLLNLFDSGLEASALGTLRFETGNYESIWI